MSKQIDSRVVSMDFDNRRFESNVNTSMSTIDKLKSKLSFSGATKGLENIGSAVKKVDVLGLSNGVETVTAKFSALQVMGITALSNITNAAVNAGKNIVNSLTIAPITDGWQEYEMTLNAVQTTMAGTGKTAEEVEKELKRLDEYADKTVYGTADMLNNLPKFTNAGVELEKATTAMIGIANATALAGGDASKASIAFYNLGQAIGTGYLSRMDYNSINNAGIATMEWKNQMIDAAIAAGTLKKAGEDAYVAGGKTFTLQQLFIDGLQHQWATTDVMMKVFEDYGNEQTEIGKKAYSAAQDIKTFTMMMDSLKATAGTGWKDTWQIIFGGLDEAKKFWTGINNLISGVLTTTSDLRNRFLDLALNGNPLSSLLDILDGKFAFDELTNAIDGTSRSLEYYRDMFKKIWRGDYSNQPVRHGWLDSEGHDHRVLQDLVNYSDEVMGYGQGWKYTLTLEDVKRSEAKFGIVVKDNTESMEERKKVLESLTDAQLKQAGLTDEQIRVYRELEKEAKRTGKSMKEIAKMMTENTGRELLIDSFKNIGKMLTGIATSIKDAFMDIFNPPSVEAMAFALYWIIDAFHRFTQGLVLNEEKMDQLKRTFSGLFAIVRILTNILGGGLMIAFKIAFKLITQLLAAFNLDILDVTAAIGDSLVAFSDWIDKTLDFTAVFEFIAPYIQEAVTAIKDWVANCEPLQKIIKYFSDLTNNISKWFEGMKDAENIPKYIIEGLVNGLQTGAAVVWEAVVALATTLIEKFQEVLGIHSPSVVFMAIGGFIIAGLIIGITQGFPAVIQAIKGGLSSVMDAIDPELKQGIANGVANVKETLKQIDWGQVFASVMSIGGLVIGYKVANSFDGISSALENIGEALLDLAEGAQAYLKTSSMKNIAISIAILAGSLLVLSLIPMDKLWNAVGVVAVLGVVLGGLVFVIGKFGTFMAASDALSGKAAAASLFKFVLILIGISSALLITAFALSKIANLDWEQLGVGLVGIIGILGTFAGIAAASKLLSAEINKFGVMVLGVAAGMLLLVAVIKIVNGMEPAVLIKGGLVIAAFATMITLMSIAMRTNAGGAYVAAFGKAVVGVGVAMLSMLVVAKLAAKMTPKDLLKGVTTIAIFGALIVGLMGATQLVSTSANMTYIGGAILKIAGALAIMMLVAKIASKMSVEDLVKGVAVVTIFGGIIVGLMAATKFLKGTQNIKHIGSAMLKISAAMAILAGLAILLSFIKLKNLAKGIAAIGLIAAMMAGIIYVSKFSTRHTGGLVAITVAIGLLSAAMVALSFLEPKKVLSSAAAMVAVLGALSLLIYSTKALPKTASVAMLMKTLLPLVGIATLLGLLLYGMTALKVDVPFGTIAGLSLLLTTMGGILVGLKYVGKIIKPTDTDDITQSIIALTAMVIPLSAFALALNIPLPANVVDNVLALSLITAAMTGLVVALSTIGLITKGLPWWGTLSAVLALTAMAVPLALFATALMIPINDNALKNVGTLALLATAMTALLYPLLGVGAIMSAGLFGHTMAAILALTAMAAPLALFATVLMIPINDNAIRNVLALSALCAAMTVLTFPLIGLGAIMVATGGAGAIAMAAGIAALLLMAIPLIAFVGVLAAMQGVDNALENTLTLILLTAALSILSPLLMIAGVGGLSGAIGLTAMAIPLIAFVGILAAMQGVDNAMDNVLALITLVGALTILMPLMTFGVGGIVGAVGLLALAIPLIAFVGILAAMQGVDNATENAIALSGMVLALTAAMIPLSLIGMLGGAAVVGVAALTAMAIPLLSFIGVLALMEHIENAQANVSALVSLLGPVTDSLVKIALVSPLIMIAKPAIIGLLEVMMLIGGLAAALGWLLGACPSLKQAVDDGMPMLASLATSLGTVVGNFIDGAISTATKSLPEIGTNLSTFMTNLETFIAGAKTIDGSALSGVKNLAGAMLILFAADFINGLCSWLDDGKLMTGLEHLGDDLSDFSEHLQPFIENTKNIDATAMNGIKALAEAVVLLTANDIVNGLMGWATGGSSLERFGEEIGSLGTSLKTFITNTGDLTKKEVTKAGLAAEVIKTLAVAASEIPNDGGWAGAIFGDNSLGTFAESIKSTGTAIQSFTSSCSKLTEDSVQKAGFACDIIKALANAASEIPNDDGWAGAIFGNNSLATFADAMPSVGTNIADFATNISNLPEGSDIKAKTAGSIITALATAAQGIPNDSGIWGKIFGENSLATFAGKLPGVATNIKDFCLNLGTMDESTIATVNAAASAVSAIAQLAAVNLGSKAKDLGKFGEALPNFGTDVSSFTSTLSSVSIESVNSAAAKVKGLVDLAKSIADVDISVLKTFGSSLTKAATDGVNDFVAAFNGEEPKNKAKKAAGALLSSAIKGAEDKTKDVKTAFEAIAQAAVDKLQSESMLKKFNTAGTNAAKGFANGIDSKESIKKASDAGTKLGKAALEAAKKALDEHSPSREMYKVGDFAGIGFINALLDNVKSAYKAGGQMADSAKKGLSGAIARITDTLNNEMDMQPTIRPVLDLSDVRSGAGSINGLFSGRTLSINSANVGAVSASMAKRQNGNDDIVSGINALRKDIAGMSNNTYNINGVTYDDGSNINSAVETLVRAARIERRT